MGKLSDEKLSMLINNKTFIFYINKLRLLATSLFTWENLDIVAGIGASDFLEQILYDEGRACFVKDNELGYLTLHVQPNDKFNVYNLPTKVMATSFEYNKEFNFKDIVYIKNNVLQLPTYIMLETCTYNLYETEVTIRTNLHAQKTPVLIEGDKNTELTLKNLYMKYSGNMPVIYGRKNFNINNKLNCINTEAPYLVDKLIQAKHEFLNEALTILGIDNANVDKKERMIVNEVDSNKQLINYFLNCWYKTRKAACNEINEKFLKNSDIKINVILNKEIYDLLKVTEDDIIKPEDQDE